jgi:hypothetical protein
MPYTVALPDGRIVEFPDSVSREKAAEILRKQFPAPEPKSAGFSVRDLLTSFGQGAVGSTQALTDVAGADNAASRKLQEASEALQQRLSPERQAEIRRQQERAKRAEESGSTWEEIKAGAQSVFEAPLQSTAQALGSFAPYIPTMFLGPAAAALGLGARATAVATNVAKAAPAAIGTAQGAGAVKGAIYKGVYDAELKDGTSEEEARAKATAAQEYFGKNIDQILLGGGAGYVAGRFGAERLLTPGAAATAERSMLGRVGTALATDVPTEAFQGGQEQYAQNLALQREGRDVPLFQGVAGAATQEGLMGALGAAPVAAIRGPGDVALREVQDRRAQESARLQAEADAQRAEQDAFRQTPEYLDTLEQRFAQIKTAEQQLKDAIPGKVDKNDPLAVEEKRRAVEALNEFKKSDEYVNTIDEYTAAYDQLRPRMQERKAAELEQQRVGRVQAAPEGTQLDLLGEPGAVPDQSLSGQIQSLNQYIGSFDKQIKQAQTAGDTQQVAALQQKQGQAREQIASLLPDPSMLADAKALAQRNLEDYQTQIKTLTEQPDKKPEQYRQLEQLNNTANQVRQALAGIEDTQKTVAKYKPVDVQKPIDKTQELAKLEKQLGKQAELGEDIGPTLEKIRALETVAEQPLLFGEEDLRTITPQGLGDIIADERERVKALREKLDGERAALQRIAATPQTQVTEEIQRRKKELIGEAQKTATELRQRNEQLYQVEKKQTLLDKLLKEPRTPLAAQGIETLQKQIAGLQQKLQEQEPKVKVQQPRTKLPAPAPEGEFAPRVTDAQLMEQRDRDIAALLDQFLPGALGVTPTQETLQVQGPEGPREVRLTTLGGTKPVTATEISNVNDQREELVDVYVDELAPAIDTAATDTELREAKRNANRTKNAIVNFVQIETDMLRQRAGGELLSKEYSDDLAALVQSALDGKAAAIPGRNPNEKIDTLVEEFAKVSPKNATATPTKYRVPAAQRPAALLGADIPAQIAANNRQIEQLNKDIQYAGRPTGAKEIAALDAMKAERDQRRAENERLEKQLESMRGKVGKPFEVAPEETGEVADMRQELATIERTLAAGTFKDNANVTQQLEAARDELIGRIEAAVGPTRPEAEGAERQLGFRTDAVSKFRVTELKLVPAEDITKAKNAVVAATQKIEDIRKAAMRVADMGPQYFQEVATTYQLQIDKETKALQNLVDRIESAFKAAAKLEDSRKTAKSPEAQQAITKKLDELQQRIADLNEQKTLRERRAEGMKEATAEVQRFLNLARLAGVNKTTNLRESLDQALDVALADKDKKEAALAELEKKQRMYEQQDAARRGIDLGQAEAEKITAGEAAGFVSGRGKALGEKPKDKRSWIVTRDSKAKVPKPAQANALESAVQKAAALVSEARREKEAAGEALKAQAPSAERIAALKDSLGSLENQINAHYAPAQAAEIQGEIGRIKAELASVPVPPAIANVAEQYNKVSTATKGLPASERVAQLMFDKGSAELKAAGQLKAAEQAVTAANAKYDASRKALEKAEKKLARLKDPKKIQGVKLQIGNLNGSAPKLRDNIQNAIAARMDAERKYMAARLERLLLVQQMGEHAKREAANITSQLASAADTVAELQKQRDTATANEATMRKKLDQSSAALEKAEDDAETARQAARNAARLAQEKEQTDSLEAAKAAQDRADAMRTGLGLPGRRVERDTAGKVMTAVQADIRQRMATAETNLSKAIKAGNPDAIRKYTAEVAATTKELAQVYSKAPLTVSEVGRESEKGEQVADEFQPKVVEGVRSTSRREGPAVRYVRGGSKAIMQSGVIKLRAAGLSQEAANAVSLYVAKNKIKGAKTTEKVEELTKAFDALTDGMTEEQVKAAVAEGKRLMGLGPTAELIAKRMAYQEALENVGKAEQELRKAQSNVTKELARDALALANQRVESASNAYDQAKALYETSQIRTAKKAENDAVEALFDEADIAQDTKGAKLGKGASRTAAAIEGGVFRTTNTAGPGMKEQRVRDIALKVVSEWSVVPDIFVVADINDLPESIREQAIKAGVADNIPGVYDPSTKTAYLVSSNLKTTEDVLLTLAHEVAGHFGLREVLGSSYARTMQKLYAGNKLVRDRADAKMQAQTFLDQNTAVEEVLADMAEVGASPQERNLLQRVYDFVKRWLKTTFPSLKIDRVTDNDVRQIVANARRYVTNADRSLLEGGAAATSGLVYRTTPESSIVGRPAGTLATLQGNLFGLAGRVQLVDRLAAADKAFVEGQKAGNLSSLEAENAQYFMRMGDMTTQAAGQFITTGPVKIVKDRLGDKFEERYESQTGANLVAMAEFMERAGQEGLGSAQEVETLLTVKIAGDRANALSRGWERLFSDNPAKAKAEYDAAVAKINANPVAKKFMDAAVAEYKAYNDGLMDFAEQTGFITSEDARRLKKTPYVPYYRIDNGVVKLFVDRETPLVIGNIKDNPDLQQLLGDNKQIMPILTSAVQNTFMLTRMGLRNKATQETASALQKAGFVTKMGEGMGLANVNTVHYKYKGKPYFATIDADQFGIPADLIIKGMEGIKTTIPDLVRLMGIPADWIRTFVTRSPAYVLRQLIRDPMNAAITGGVDGVPVLNALKQFAKMRAGRNPSADALMRGLAVSSNIYTGNEQDMQKFLEAASSGRGKWSKMMGMFDQFALESDAATRSAIYEDALKKGLSERQAQFRALEAQNFSRRGLSPSVQYLSTLVPFFNAQIQGLDALYRSFRGRMPFSEKLEIRKKLAVRGSLLIVTALGYAFMMRDNEEYKKATPEERYSNFFVPLPGTKEMFKIPIPYEVGLLFKALPEAILDSILGDTKAKEAAKGIGKLLLQSAPGVIPAAGKPVLEAVYGQTMIGPIESEREKQLPAGQRFREATPEVLKTLGSYTGEIGISPLLIEHFVKGYTSMLGVSVLRMLDPVMGEALDNKATAPLSKMPFFGGLFQTADGRFLIERAYSRMEDITQAVQGYEDLQKRGKKAEAEEFAQRKADLLAAADMAGTFRKRSGDMFADERAIRAEPSLTREQKDALLEKLKAAQQEEARQFYAASERTIRQQPRP